MYHDMVKRSLPQYLLHALGAVEYDNVAGFQVVVLIVYPGCAAVNQDAQDYDGMRNRFI